VPLLWKVSDANNSVYLLGSFHMLRADDYPLSKDVDAALADSESVLFETSAGRDGVGGTGQEDDHGRACAPTARAWTAISRRPCPRSSRRGRRRTTHR
jgi:hypothetical protein